MNVAGKKILVVGAARSGIACAKFLTARGATVALNDAKPFEKWSAEALALKDEGVGCLDGELPGWLLDQLDLVVISPGVPTKAIPLRYAERAGAEVIGEVELASRYLKGRIVAITGSNGKTTTTSLIAELLKDAGLRTLVGGNIGTPLISLVEDSSDDGWTVVEMSSFQLETIKEFHPTVAVALNVTPNHMDRYESFTDYAAAKHRIFMNQAPGDVAILNADDEIVSSWASGLRAHVTRFSVKQQLEEGLFLRGREIISRANGVERVLLMSDEMKLRGLHNVENVLAAVAVGLACGAAPNSMRETIRKFNPVEHRLEFVTEVDGVKFYNDSKATSVDATVKALEAFAGDVGKVVLILGGRGKKAPYAPLESLVRKGVRKLVLVGEDAETIERELGPFASNERAKDMSDAVTLSFHAAQPGDTVLLAPACASFDMFESYEHRGHVFKDAVSSLRSQVSGITESLSPES
ncbi:MAG TPA: UDP-N-acetylmuramoyl-L-alanine--D-glutamate ligase [Pyrinomonadaceae bacterium]|jgi:UDP-N-acetylmuramoylalanine--D-glutamate ligase|nr:UDP-N-acetylmuramoyl-L-alanine--D-glutamate ligase [Pyrinomonadaceae bacterium]